MLSDEMHIKCVLPFMSTQIIKNKMTSILTLLSCKFNYHTKNVKARLSSRANTLRIRCKKLWTELNSCGITFAI